MKNLTFLFLFLSFSVFSQTDIFVDPRDGQEYRTTNIQGLTWMLDDLNYFTDYSFDLSKENQEKYHVPEARWYHLTEIDSVCPDGWRLPTGDEWLTYVKMRLEERGMKYSEGTYRSDYAIWAKKNEDIELYEVGNPLGLQVMGIYEGEEFIQAPGSADYWIQDIPMKSDVDKNSEVRAVKLTYPNRHMYISILIVPTSIRTCTTSTSMIQLPCVGFW